MRAPLAARLARVLPARAAEEREPPVVHREGRLRRRRVEVVAFRLRPAGRVGVARFPCSSRRLSIVAYIRRLIFRQTDVGGPRDEFERALQPE